VNQESQTNRSSDHMETARNAGLRSHHCLNHHRLYRYHSQHYYKSVSKQVKST